MPFSRDRSRRRHFVAGAVIGALALLAGLAGPAAAAPPGRVIFKLDGLSASATFVEWEPAGDLDRATVTILQFGRHRTNNRAEPPTRQEIVSVNVQTYWLPTDRASDNEIVATMEETGAVSLDGAGVEIDEKYLRYARLGSTDVGLDTLYCSAASGWQSLCEEAPSERTITLEAELTGIGELEGDRYTAHEEIFVCRFLEVGSHSSRDADGTVWVDGTPHTRLIPWMTYITDGTTFVRALCRP